MRREPDRARVAAFLAPHADSSMFLLGNLARPEVDFWVWPDAGPIEGVFGLTPEGYANLQAPTGLPALAVLRHALSGRRISGVNGPAGPVEQLCRALALGPASLDRVEPMLVLDLAALTVPQSGGVMRQMAPADLPLVADWRAAYMAEIMGAEPGPATRALARAQTEQMLAGGKMRLLERAGQVVGMTGFNAETGNRVQVGSVYTPPEWRGRGVARRLVALHLQQAREGGAQRAVLFAANPPAARAYQAIGFRQSGSYHLVMLATPQQVA